MEYCDLGDGNFLEKKVNSRVENINDDFECEDDYSLDLENVLDDCEDDFVDVIRERGVKYYHDGHVISCFKNKNCFYAKVVGSNDSIYDVSIWIYGDYVDYECNCPCEYPCKHEYAVLMAISNGKYNDVLLKDKINENKKNLCEMVELIPADDLKNYLLSVASADNISFDTKSFENYFSNYLPNQSYEYYYNNLYNVIVLNNDFDSLINIDLVKIKEYISYNKFDEAFKIIKAIINAITDTYILNNDMYLIDLFLKLGMFLRIVYRKGDDSVHNCVNEWCEYLKENNYFNNFYLEDIVLQIL